MIPCYLRLSGFLSYDQPVELDFAVFDLACISGPNGAGKSTLLDAITWALFGQARRRDDALINSHAKAAEVVFDFNYEGSLYRIQRTKPREKPTVLEFYLRDAESGWKPLTEHSLRETEMRIQKTLRMDYETFTNASFFLQGRADQFAQQRPADRKRILSSILGLEIWETYRERASARRKQVETELTMINGQLEEIQTELKQEDERRARLKQLQENLAQAAALRQAKDELLENLRRLAASLDEQRRLVQVLEDQEKAAQKRLADSREKLSLRQEEEHRFRQQVAHAAEVEAAYQAWQALRLELERWETVAANFRQHESLRAGPLLAIESERARLSQERQSLLDQQHSVQELEASLPGIKDLLADVHTSLAETSTCLEQRPLLEAKRTEIQEGQAAAKADNQRLKIEMNDLKERIARLKQTGGATCPVCGKPLNPDERMQLIGELEIQGKEKGDQYRSNQELTHQLEQRRQDTEAQLETLTQLEAGARPRQRQADQLADRQAQILQETAKWQSGGMLRLQKGSTLLEEQAYAQGARAELALVDASLKEIGYDAAAHDATRRAEQAGRASQEQYRLLETARARLDPLEREIASLSAQVTRENSEAEVQLENYRAALSKYENEAARLPDLNQAESEKFALQEQENHLRAEVGGAVQKVEVLKSLRLRQKDLIACRDELKNQVVQLKMLERAFGKDGVPALLIEQTLPEIEAQAQKILDNLSNGSMSVWFATQKDFKDKNRDDKKETLDIMISDATGSRREYELFSGGEAFRINFAIRLALSRVLAQRAGARLQMLVIDEGFGSQDAEGRQRLIEAINLVRHDFAKVLVITHLEELKDAFPTRIEVEKTQQGSKVTVVS
jgi:exonuclease SbcC